MKVQLASGVSTWPVISLHVIRVSFFFFVGSTERWWPGVGEERSIEVHWW